MSKQHHWKMVKEEARGRCQGFLIDARKGTIEEYNATVVARQKDMGIVLDSNEEEEGLDQPVILVTGRKPGARLIQQAWTGDNSSMGQPDLTEFTEKVTPEDVIDLHRSFFAGDEYDVWTETETGLRANMSSCTVTVRMDRMHRMIEKAPELHTEQPVAGVRVVLKGEVPEARQLVYVLGMKGPAGTPPMMAPLLPEDVPGHPTDLAGLAQRLLPRDIVRSMMQARLEADKHKQETQP